jgi:hypothetical protein
MNPHENLSGDCQMDVDVDVDVDVVPDVVMVARVFVHAPKPCALPNTSLCSVSSVLMRIAQP